MHLLSIIIPVYNEGNTVHRLLEEMLGIQPQIPVEYIVIDDGSTDQTAREINQFLDSGDNRKKMKYIPCSPNRGKGYAVRQGIKHSQGNILLIQDADFEYDHSAIPALLQPILDGRADLVYGSRYLQAAKCKNQILLAFLANKFLTACLNLLYGNCLTDLHTCYKVFTGRVKDTISLTSDDFGIDVELTAKALRKGFRIKELPINYQARSKKGGKKITWRDGLLAFGYLLKFRWGVLEFINTQPFIPAIKKKNDQVIKQQKAQNDQETATEK